MLRRVIIIAALGAALAAPADAAAAKTTSVRVVECKSSDAGETRSATFLGRMRKVGGSDQMLMRFTLLERFGDEKLHAVKTPELRAWRQSKPGVREFRFRQTVTALQGGGQYRMRVDFRWLDDDGNLIRKARTTSPACEQPGDLPNLRIGEVTAQRGTGGTWNYVVPILNNGQVTTGDFAVQLFVDGAAANVGHVDSIPPGETREVRFTGPACQRGVRAVADPGDAVKERFESDNTLKHPCPILSG
jgi:hypothetical protein